MLIASTIYCTNYIGPWALIGSLVMLLYYPYQVRVTTTHNYYYKFQGRLRHINPGTNAPKNKGKVFVGKLGGEVYI